MTTTYAGLWGPWPFIDALGNRKPSSVVKVYDGGTQNLATLYADRDKTTPLANPLPHVAVGEIGLDTSGNGSFYAAPGTYELQVLIGTTEVYRGTIVVNVDPSEQTDSDAAAIAALSAAFTAHAADSTGVHGITDTAALETSTGSQAKADAAQAAAIAAASALVDDLSGITDNAGATTKLTTLLSGTFVTRDLTAFNLAFDGDSMTLSSKSWYPEIASEGVIGAVKHNFGRSGENWAEMIVGSVEVDAAVDPAKTNVLSLLAGINDIADGFTAADIYANIVAYCTARKAAGWDLIVIGTILPSTLFSYVPADCETKRLALNTLIRANAEGLFDAIADAGADAIIGLEATTADATYYSDLLHPTAFGAGILAHYFREAYESLGMRIAETGTLLLSGYRTDGNVRLGAKAMPDARTGQKNTALGISALETNQSGDENVAVGYEALWTNGTGGFNTALGVQALYSNVNGAVNTAVGWQALYANTTGSAEVAVGYKALHDNTSGANNTAVGYQAMQHNTTGANNAGFGIVALEENTTGSFNAALGSSALQKNTTGQHNTAVGYQALNLNTLASDNVAVGYKALAVATGALAIDNVAVGSSAMVANTAGYQNVAIGSSALVANLTGHENVAIGYLALSTGTDASNNTAVGVKALQNSTAAFNSAMGYEALQANIGGQHNTASGAAALHTITSGSDNTGVGYNVLPLSNTSSRQTALGSGAGLSSSTQRDDITTIGYAAKANGNYATALGSGASAGAAGSVALGTDSAGTGASTTTADKIKLGTALHTVDCLGGRLMLGEAPSTPGTPTAGGVLYVESGVLKYKGSSGTVTLLAAA